MKKTATSQGMRRNGFTLIEVLIATGISTTVLAMAITVFIAAQRILESAMSQTQIAFELRMLREKLLFRIDDNGGLMSARQSTIDVENAVGGWGDTLRYTPLDGNSENVVRLPDAGQKLEAQNELSDGWLSSGQIRFALGTPFRESLANGEIHVDAAVSIRIGDRIYGQKQRIRSQIMSR